MKTRFDALNFQVLVHERNFGIPQHLDTKISVLAAAGIAGLGYSFSISKDLVFVRVGFAVSEAVLFLLISVAISGFLGSLFTLMMALKARRDGSLVSLMSFLGIANLTSDAAYSSRVDAMDEAGFRIELARHNYEIAHIIRHKIHWINLALALLAIGLLGACAASAWLKL